MSEGTTSEGQALGIIIIQLSSKTSLGERRVSWFRGQNVQVEGRDWGNHDRTVRTSADDVGFVDLIADASIFNKMKKAFEHLRDVYQQKMIHLVNNFDR